MSVVPATALTGDMTAEHTREARMTPSEKNLHKAFRHLKGKAFKLIAEIESFQIWLAGGKR
jgi:hypothetical protein